MIWGSALASQLQPLHELETRTRIQLLEMRGKEKQGVHTMCNIPILEYRRNEQLAIIIFNIPCRGIISIL